MQTKESATGKEERREATRQSQRQQGQAKKKRLTPQQIKARKRRRFIRHLKVHLIRIALAAAAVLLIVLAVKGIMAAVHFFGNRSTQEVEAQTTEAGTVQSQETVTEYAWQQKQIEKYGCVIYQEYGYPWNQMSQDWGGEEIEGFYYHEISDEAKAAGGEAPVIGQIYLYCLCRKYGVDYETAFALIERESYWQYNAVGDDGESIGLMMVQPKWHMDKMEDLNAMDLTDPYANMTVGVAYMAQMYEATGNDADMLAAYNYGLAGARLKLWTQGKHLYTYNREIMERARELKAETAAAQAAAESETESDAGEIEK